MTQWTDAPPFAEPWQAKAFALAVTLSERGLFSWSEWSDRLAAEIARSDAEYWFCWVAALEGLVGEKSGAEI